MVLILTRIYKIPLCLSHNKRQSNTDLYHDQLPGFGYVGVWILLSEAEFNLTGRHRSFSNTTALQVCASMNW